MSSRSSTSSVATVSLFVALACGSAPREEIAATVGPSKTEPAKTDETKKTPPASVGDPVLLDRLLVAEPTYLWSSAAKQVACSGSTRKGDDTTYSVDIFDATGERIGGATHLIPSAREFGAKRKALDAQLANGFTALRKVAWPAHERTLVLADLGLEVEWTDKGELVVTRGKGKGVVTKALDRKDKVPVAVHVGASDALAVQVTFDPKDTTTLDVQYTECVVLPLSSS